MCKRYGRARLANRILRGVVAAFIAVFALASWQTPVVALFGALTSTLVLITAITGTCLGTPAGPVPRGSTRGRAEGAERTENGNATPGY